MYFNSKAIKLSLAGCSPAEPASVFARHNKGGEILRKAVET